MKRIVIGRGNDCDIVIPDELDNVSRHHAVITIDYFGRMTLSDTSSNGTLINGNRMLKGASIPVTRNDKIQFGAAWIFDWNLVEDPYRSNRRICMIGIVMLIILAICGGLWFVYDAYFKERTYVIEPQTVDVANDSSTWNKDSTEKVAPVEVNINTPKPQKQTVVKVKQTSPSSSGKAQKSPRTVKKQFREKKTTDKSQQNTMDIMEMRKRKDSEKNSSNGEMPVIN